MDVMDSINSQHVFKKPLRLVLYYLVASLVCSFITFAPNFISAIVQSAPPIEIIEGIVIYLFLFLSLSWIYVILVVACILIWLNQVKKPVRLKDFIVPTSIITIIIYVIYFKHRLFGLVEYRIDYPYEFMYVVLSLIWAMVYVYAFKYFFPTYFKENNQIKDSTVLP